VCGKAAHSGRSVATIKERGEEINMNDYLKQLMVNIDNQFITKSNIKVYLYKPEWNAIKKQIAAQNQATEQASVADGHALGIDNVFVKELLLSLFDYLGSGLQSNKGNADYRDSINLALSHLQLEGCKDWRDGKPCPYRGIFNKH
jgi:hypothetical protein